jgi:hypothetical protein
MISVANILNSHRRSKISSRGAVMFEANRRGLLVGFLSRASKPIGRAEARLKAAESALGLDPVQNCSVPERWRPLFKRVFVKAAVHAAHADRNVTTR